MITKRCDFGQNPALTSPVAKLQLWVVFEGGTVNEEGVCGKALALPQNPFQGLDLDIVD